MAEGMRHLRVASGEVSDINAAREKRECEVLREIFEHQKAMLAIIEDLTEGTKIRQENAEDVAGRLLGELKDWIEMTRKLAGISEARLGDYIDEQMRANSELPKVG